MNIPRTSGFLNIYKTVGPTSYDCIRALKRVYLRENSTPPKMGHLGTLDPLAEGVLPVAIGPAGKLIRFFTAEKVYRATIRLGLATATDDSQGAVLAEADTSLVDETSIRAALANFGGEIEQVPPRFSAVSTGGVKAYKRARAGADFALKPKRVRISRIELLDWTPPELEVRLTVGPGTYIRAFARDLGAKLGVGGCIAALVRESDGPFLAADALTVAEIERTGVNGIAGALYPPDFILRGFQRVDLTLEQGKAFTMGKGIHGVEIPDDGLGYIGVYDDEGFIGMGTKSANGCLKPIKIIRAEGY